MDSSPVDQDLDRRLAGILAADVVGYSALVDKNEENTIRAVKSLWSNIVEPSARNAGGRVVKTMGDGVLAEFPSAVKAVQCAMSVQEATASGDTAFPDGVKLVLRIGLHLGDVVIDGDDILGDGVNLAARLEALADPGGICISAAIRDQLSNELAALFQDCGEKQVKNISRPIRVYAFNETSQEAAGIEEGRKDGFEKPTVALETFDCLTKNDDTQLLAQGSQQTTAALLSCQTGLKLVPPQARPDYLVTASFQLSGERYRSLLTIISRNDDLPVLSTRLDGRSEDPFELQDEVSAKIATTIRYTILENEAKLASQAKNATPEQRLARAGHLLMGASLEDWNEAGALLDEYIAECPDAFMALSMKACYLLSNASLDVLYIPEKKALEAKDVLDRARQLNEQSDFMHLIRSLYEYGVNFDLDAALRAVERSLEVTPEYILGRNIRAFLMAMDGRAEEALADHKVATASMSKNPIYQRIVSVRAWCHFAMGDHPATIAAAQESLEHCPTFTQALTLLASTAYLSGQESVGQRAMEPLMKIHPDLTQKMLRPLPFRDSTIWKAHLEGLDRAGLPKG
ncbi:MAG: hypothetical protein NXI27_26915 [Alphaproteobacteria bacterium]|nr:hypothetical protein [Alphaproteobacteria bacterium]